MAAQQRNRTPNETVAVPSCVGYTRPTSGLKIQRTDGNQHVSDNTSVQLRLRFGVLFPRLPHRHPLPVALNKPCPKPTSVSDTDGETDTTCKVGVAYNRPTSCAKRDMSAYMTYCRPMNLPTASPPIILIHINQEIMLDKIIHTIFVFTILRSLCDQRLARLLKSLGCAGRRRRIHPNPGTDENAREDGHQKCVKREAGGTKRKSS